ncbi:MAG: discoidin domain-containing protein [Bacteroidaceae bacterium]|nr:discoidin domain-containing protein [Bacteroidaceae bacterium]
MRKFTLLIASLFITIGAMAQTDYDYGYLEGTISETGHIDHHPLSVSITGEDGKVQKVDNISTGKPYPSYFDKTENTLKVVCGETVKPDIDINGAWMHAYVYVDWNRDDKFTVHLTGTGPYSSGDGNELVAYTYYGNADGNSGWNTAGTPVSGNQAGDFAEYFGSFTVPEGLEAGTKLRMRFTVMWNCIDPTGKSYAGDKFLSDGASIIDVTLEVVEEAADDEKAELLKYVGKANNVLDKFGVKYKDEQIVIANKISTNAGQNENNTGVDGDGDGLTALTDNDVNTYFHSRWGGTYVNEDHYLQIDLGENSTLSDFFFEYSVRKGEADDRTSPAPTRIEVRVSEDGTDFGDPLTVLTKDADNLPPYTDHGNTLWCSNLIEANKNVRYIRFTVTDVEGPGNIAWDGTNSYKASERNGRGHVFFALSALNLYSSTRLPDQIIAIKEALAAAGSVNENAHLKKNDVNASVSEIIEVLKPYYYELNVSAAKYATMFLNFATAIPDVVKAYVVKNEGVKDKYITLTEVTGVIPAETGVIIEAEEGEYDFMASNDEATDVTGNLLKGTLIEKQVDEDAYILAMVGNEVGLYVAAKDKKADGTAPAEGETGTHFTCYANKAYLPASALTAEQQNSVGFRFDFGTTAVEKVEMRNEKEEIYDLQGRRINEITQPGIYVVNGVKRVVK